MVLHYCKDVRRFLATFSRTVTPDSGIGLSSELKFVITELKIFPEWEVQESDLAQNGLRMETESTKMNFVYRCYIIATLLLMMQSLIREWSHTAYSKPLWTRL